MIIFGSTSNSLLIGVSVVVGGLGRVGEGGCPPPRWGREPQRRAGGGDSAPRRAILGRPQRFGQIQSFAAEKVNSSPRELGGSSFEDKPGGIDCSFGGLWSLFWQCTKA